MCCSKINPSSKQNDSIQVRSSSLPPRPPTRRSVYDMPEDIEVVFELHYVSLRKAFCSKVPIRPAPRSKSQTRLSKSEKSPKLQQSVVKPDGPVRKSCIKFFFCSKFLF